MAAPAPPQHYHEVMLAKALALYGEWKIEPFHVIDIDVFHDDNDERKDINCLCFHLIFGRFENVVRVIPIDKDIVSYLLVATGGQNTIPPGWNQHPESLRSLWERRRGERNAWLRTQTVTLDLIETLAHQHLDAQEFERMSDLADRERKYTHKKFFKRRGYRWEPYSWRARQHDPPDPVPVAVAIGIPPAADELTQ
jgi:hypothetical protein